MCVWGGVPGWGPLIAGTLVTNASRIKTQSLTPMTIQAPQVASSWRRSALLMSFFCCLFLCVGEGGV